MNRMARNEEFFFMLSVVHYKNRSMPARAPNETKKLLDVLDFYWEMFPDETTTNAEKQYLLLHSTYLPLWERWQETENKNTRNGGSLLRLTEKGERSEEDSI